MANDVGSRTIMMTAAELAAAQTRGDVLQRHQLAFISDAVTGTPQWIRGTGAAITAAETVQAAGQAPGQAAARNKVTTSTALALTHAAHNAAEVHAEAGGSLSIAATGFRNANGDYLPSDVLIFNNTGAVLSLSVAFGGANFAGFLTPDQDAATPGTSPATFAIPADSWAQIVVDEDGFVRAAMIGNVITKAALDTAFSTRDTAIGLREVAANKVTTAASIASTAAAASYPSALAVHGHVAARRGAFDGTAITVSTTLTAWDEIRTINASAQDVIVTLPSVASQDGELVISRLDNSTNIVAVKASGAETLLGVPAGTTYVTLLPGGSIRLRATAAGPARLNWSAPGLVARLWTPADMIRAIDVDFTVLAAGAIASMPNSGALGGTFDQAAGGAQPSISADASGINGAVFDGSADFLESSLALALGANYGLFAAMRPTLPSGGMIISEAFAGDGNVRYALGYMTAAASGPDSTLRSGHYNGAWRLQAAPSASASGAIDIGIGNYDGTNHNLRRFGTDSIVAQASASGTSTEKTFIGRRWDTGGPAFYGGRIFRVVGKAGAFTTQEMEWLEGYAAHLLGVASSLAAGHVYRTAPALQTLVAY